MFARYFDSDKINIVKQKGIVRSYSGLILAHIKSNFLTTGEMDSDTVQARAHLFCGQSCVHLISLFFLIALLIGLSQLVVRQLLIMSGDVELNPGPLDDWWIENYLLVLTLTLKCIYGFSDQIEIEQILATIRPLFGAY